MISRTADMFENAPTVARRRDPVTSKKGAVKSKATRVSDKSRLLDLITRMPGKTASEYSEELKKEGMPAFKADRMVTKRASDLIKDRSIYAFAERVCTVTGHAARPYYPTRKP